MRLRALVAEGADILFLDSPQSEEEMRTGIAACAGKPALAVTSPAGKHFMPGDAELERVGIRIVATRRTSSPPACGRCAMHWPG